MNKNLTPIRLGNIYGERFSTGFGGNVWSVNALSPALMTAQGGGRTPMVIVKVNDVHYQNK